jgi:hypothetical protein
VARLSLLVSAVNYPAPLNFSTAADGMAYITEDLIPDGYAPPPGITGPMPRLRSLGSRIPRGQQPVSLRRSRVIVVASVWSVRGVSEAQLEP